MTPPRRTKSPPPSAPPVVGLFPDHAVTIEPSRHGKRTAQQKHREFLHVTDHVVLYLSADGKAGAESPMREASWESMERWARTRLAEFQRDADFLQRWLKAEKRGEVELRA